MCCNEFSLSQCPGQTSRQKAHPERWTSKSGKSGHMATVSLKGGGEERLEDVFVLLILSWEVE